MHNLVEAPDKRRRELIRIDGGTRPRVRISGAFKRGKQVFYVATDDRVRCIITDMVEHVAEPRDDADEDSHG